MYIKFIPAHVSGGKAREGGVESVKERGSMELYADVTSSLTLPFV